MSGFVWKALCFPAAPTPQSVIPQPSLSLAPSAVLTGALLLLGLRALQCQGILCRLQGLCCWMSEFWMTNSYKTLASFLVNSTPEQQVAGRMAFKPPACLVPRCSQPLKSLAASFPAQLLLLCLPRFPLEFPQLPLSLLSGLWWSCAALLNYCHTELRGQQHPCNSQRGMGKEFLQQGVGQGSCTVPQHRGL